MSTDMVSGDIQVQLSTLERREKTLSRRIKQFLPFAICSAITAGIAGIASHFMGPSLYPAVDIPPYLIGLFPDVSENLSASHGGAGLDGLITSAAFKIKTLVMAAGGVVAVVGVVSSVLSGRIEIALKFIGMAAFIGVSGLVVDFVVDADSVDPDNSSGSTQREAFVQSAKDHNYGQVFHYLEIIHQTESNMGLYLLAQTALPDKGLQKAVATTAEKASRPTENFTPEAGPLYAIEMAAFGEPKSSLAIEYRDTHLARQAWLDGLAKSSAGWAVLAGILALATVALKGVIARRVKRIKDMLGKID